MTHDYTRSKQYVMGRVVPREVRKLEAIYRKRGLRCQIDPSASGGVFVYAGTKTIAEKVANDLAGAAWARDRNVRVIGEAVEDQAEPPASRWWVSVVWSWSKFG